MKKLLRIKKYNADNILFGILLFLVILNLIFLFYRVNWNFEALIKFISELNVEKVKTYVLSFGIIGPLIFILLEALDVVLFFVPSYIFTIAGGLLWGLFLGIIFSTLGAIIGAFISFNISRLVGRRTLELIFNKKEFGKFDSFFLKHKNMIWVFILAFLPFSSLGLLSYFMGFTKVDIKYFMIATALGIFLNKLLLVSIGFALGIGSWTLLLVILGVILLSFITFLLWDKINFLLKRERQYS